MAGGAGLQSLRRPRRGSRARRPRRPHVVAGRARHRELRPLRAFAGTARSVLARQPRRVRRRVRSRPRRWDAGDRRCRDGVPRRQQAAATEAEPAAAVPRDHREVGLLQAGGARRGQRDRAHPRLARPPAGAFDAPASEPQVALGQARRRPPRRQHGLRRRVRRYRALLDDQSTFASATVEDLLDADVLPAQTATALRDRYLPS